MADPTRIVVGMSGASGAIYGIRLLEVLAAEPGVETHLVMSPAARRTIELETDRRPDDVEALAAVCHRFGDVAAVLSSGSFRTGGMVVAPCSMGTLSAIAMSSSDNLLERAADVALKERRRLVLVTREAPLHLGHLRLMVQATEMGAIIFPPVPAFYTHPQTVGEVVDHVISRILDTLGVELREPLAPRWQGVPSSKGPVSFVSLRRGPRD